jgi:hypothetical protein
MPESRGTIRSEQAADRRDSSGGPLATAVEQSWSVLHSDPQSQSLALPAGAAADHSQAVPRATHTRRNR